MKLIQHIEPQNDRVYAECMIRESGYVMPAYHCHAFYELFYVERGACRFMIEDSMYDLHEGTFLLIPPQVLHYTRYLFGSCKRFAIFFRKEDVPAEVSAALPEGDDFLFNMRIFQVQELHRDEIENTLTKMVREERIKDSRSALLLTVLLQELLTYCSRVCTFLTDTPADIHTTDRSIVLAARFISEHYSRYLKTADIAAAAGLSPNYLTRKFREAAGIGLREYLVFIRLQHAALELRSTDASVTEIALRCGFSDGNYFKDVFKKNYGMSPREYRKNRTHHIR